ncbi:shikimate dehydrogenase [Streptomyces sp. NPDC001858]
MAHDSFLIGLIGSGIGASFSPELHQREADRHGLRYLYRLIDLDTRPTAPERMGELLHAARNMGFTGLNITLPCKQLVVDHLDALSEQAELIGAVNTVVFGADGRATGHNTDVTGFGASFAHSLPEARLDRVVLLGAGGAGAAVAHAILARGAGHLTILDPLTHRATALATSLTRRYGTGRASAETQDRLPALLPHADGLLHATPTGTAAHPGLPLPPELLHPRLWVADVVYRPLETALLRAARTRGCTVLDGLGMVAFQAADAFRLFTGREPDNTRMLADADELAHASE